MCPFEDKIVNKFLFFNNRDNAKCPYCGSLERHRLVQLFIKKLNLNFNNMLHFAPEQIMQTQFQKISKKIYFQILRIILLFSFRNMNI